MPSHTVVYEWLAQKPDFAEKYARAREDQAETLADEIQAIADEEPPTVPTKFGEQIDTGWLMWQKQRVDARKWTASKLKPRKYGDRLTHAGDADNPVAVQADISIFDAMLKNLETKRQLGDK
jgi:Ser-tRNA(Ala) deacylase AlaX